MGTRPPRKNWHRLSNIRHDELLADCSVCGPDAEVKAKSDPRMRSGVAHYCMTPVRSRPSRIHGLSRNEAQDMIAKAGSRCAICGGTDPRHSSRNWQIDHDHRTGQIRGVLCYPCNIGIGFLGDDPDRLLAAAEYLTAYRQNSL